MGIFTEVCDDCTRRTEWVLTSARLPEHHKPVLVSGGLAYLDGNSLWRTYMERCFDGTPRLLNWTPKYWAPLPKPPE
jgi:hypothetical protein